MDPVMNRIMQAQELASSGDRAGARSAFENVWRDVGTDPLHVVTLAHYMADVQDDPADELRWDLRALQAADSLTDARAQEHHSTLQVAGFYPSLHLNLAADYNKLGRVAEAHEHLTKAEDAAGTLTDDGYGRMIRGAIARLRAEFDRDH
ncbi:UNVERIFIED_ORG: hypothetical protein FNL38_101262 [Nocardia globerula]|uniref:Tetratricopeptide repeat protein n=1 Tax=Nocardia globerula TaxID=1818 RepID=A0A652YW17_NOCGL|nr:hypothetical protein [Rhodococcus globerulus]NMD59713.1 hypothetical protein [Nocardia globerula]PVX64201.1 hypothetical protein C8E04_1474 [Rhodococcus globerulus]